MPEHYIRARGVTKTYRSGASDLVVFENLDLDVDRGEMLALVGESGAGKSTLLHLVGRSGQAFERYDILRKYRDFRSRGLGTGGFSESGNWVCLADSLPAAGVYGAGKRDDAVADSGRAARAGRPRNRWRGWMKWGFERAASHRAGELSGGEQQRVVLARALVGKPSVLLADEPTGNLDFRTGEMIFELLEGLHRSHQLTSVLVTHNLSFARRCDRVLNMEKGGLVPGRPTGSQPGADPGVSLSHRGRH